MNEAILSQYIRKAGFPLALTVLVIVILVRPSASIDHRAPVAVHPVEHADYTPSAHSKSTDKPIALRGIDVSHFQGKVDWQQVQHSVDYVYIKATDGITYTDPRFHSNAQATTALKIPSGAYHFFEPKDDPLAQAKHFVKTIEPMSLTLRPVLDIEISRGVAPAELAKSALAFLEHVEAQTGCRPVVYTFADFWQQNLGKQFNDYPFWLAGYTKKPHPPQDRPDWNLWQYSQTGRVKGLQGSVDRDLFEGDQAQFDALKCIAPAG